MVLFFSEKYKKEKSSVSIYIYMGIALPKATTLESLIRLSLFWEITNISVQTCQCARRMHWTHWRKAHLLEGVCETTELQFHEMAAGYLKYLMSNSIWQADRYSKLLKYALHCFSESFHAVYTNIKIYRVLYGIVLYLTYLCVTTVFILFAIITLQVKYIHSLHLTFIYFNYTLNYVFHGPGEMTQW